MLEKTEGVIKNGHFIGNGNIGHKTQNGNNKTQHRKKM